MICQVCGVEAETKQVCFRQNIGALVVRFHKSIDGRLCKSCVHKHFWRMSGTTLLLGWWGTISLIVTPIFLANNIGRYLTCLSMAPVATGAAPPQLTEAAIAQIHPHANDIFRRLNAGEEFAEVASSIAQRVGVTPGQVALYVQAVIKSQNQQ